MNKQRLQIIAVVAVVLFSGGMLYLGIGPGSGSDIPPEARKIIQAAHEDDVFDDGGSATAERTGGTNPSQSGARLTSDGEGEPRQADANSSDDEAEARSKKKSSTRRKKGRKDRSQDDAREEDDAAPKSGKKVTPNKTAS